MIKNRIAYLLLCTMIALLSACTQAPQGAGKKALQKVYGNYTFLQTVYTESMIRAATKLVRVDSTFDISGNTEYLLQFEVQRNARYFVPKTDSLILDELEKSELENYFSLEQPKGTMHLFGKQKDGVVENMVFVESDSTAFKIYEFVGSMPLSMLMEQGITNFDKLKTTLNLDLFNNGRNDSANK